MEIKSRDIIFVYDAKMCIPNGDFNTGEQRYDDVNQKILVSDVRTKRFIRDYLKLKGEKVYVSFAEYRKRMKDLDQKDQEALKNKSGSAIAQHFLLQDDPKFNLQKMIDARLFGALSTIEGENVSMTGPVQFQNLNESLNQVHLRDHVNTSVFPSSGSNKSGAIGNTSIVPYAVIQIVGWLNSDSAKETGLTQNDLDKMYAALWHSINKANTRTKNNQQSIVLFDIVYKDDYKTPYLYNQIKIKTNKNPFNIMSPEDYTFDFSKLAALQNNEHVECVNFYTDFSEIETVVLALGSKFKKMTLIW